MSVVEEISRMSKSGCDDKELLDYIYENYDEIECEFNGDEYKEPKKRNINLCIDCNMEKIKDYDKSTFNQIYVASYNHTDPTISKLLQDNFF